MRTAWILVAMSVPGISGASFVPCAPKHVRAPSGDGALEFEALGQRLLSRADAKGSPPLAAEASAEDRLLARLSSLHHRLRLGACEVWVPREAQRTPEGRPVAATVAACAGYAQHALKLERAWLEHMGLEEKARNEAKKAIGALEAWTRTWKEGHIGETKPDVEAALDRVAEAFRGPTAAAQSAPAAGFTHAPALFVTATRTDFASLLGATGIFDPSVRGALWIASVRTWLSAALQTGVGAVCLSYGPPGEDGPPLVDNPMSPGEVAPQVVHQVSHLLTAQALPGAPPWLLEGMALADTVAQTKNDETRCSGSSAGNETSAKSGFQAGQIEDFRMLPGMPAELSPYRRGPSSHYFVKELARARAGDGFKIVDFQTGKPLTITGPFLLPREKIPAAVATGEEGLKPGYAEFFRAYVGSFAHFLGEQTHEKKPLLPALIRALQAKGRGADFHATLAALTGRTLGESLDAKKDWEAAFVAWLDAQR